MGHKRRRWLWLLLLLLLIPAKIWNSRRQADTPSAKSDKPPANESRLSVPQKQADFPVLPQRDSAIVPVYIPVREARLVNYERNSIFILTGRVTSEDGGALPGAVVSLHSAKGIWPDYQWPKALISQTTDVEGRYTIRLSSRLHAFVLVRRDGFAQREAEVNFVVPETIEMDHRLRPARACAEGYVRDQAGMPISGAIISLVIGDVVMATVHSTLSPIIDKADASGHYRLRGLPEGKNLLQVFSDRHLSDSARIALKAGDCERVDFTLTAGILLSLNVKNAHGEAIPRALAYVSGHSSDEAYVGAGDETGIVRLAVPPDLVPFDCAITATGYKGYKLRIESIVPQSLTKEIILENAEVSTPSVFKGIVVDETGVPVEGAKLEAAAISEGTDRNGRFSMVVASGAKSGIRVRVSKAGYVPQEVIPGFIEQPKYRLGGEKSDAEEIITLKRSGGLFGRAVDEAGNPVRRFSLFLKSETGASYHRDFDNDNGLFSVGDVPPGIYDLAFSSLPVNLESSFVVTKSNLRSIEIRRGFYYGEIIVIFSPGRLP
jgi:hypothetical protein